MSSNLSTGEYLTILRGDMTQEVVAKELNISVSALSMYENDSRTPRDEIKVRIANFYGVSVQDLFFRNKVH